MTSRPRYQPGFAGRDSAWNRNGDRYWDQDRGRGRDWDHDGDHDRNRDRFRDRAHSFQNWYLYSYPASLGYQYPFVLDPGFYDWSGYDDSVYGQDNPSSDNQSSGYPPQYPNGDYAEPGSGAYGDQGQQPPPWPGEYVPENPPTDTGVSAAFAPPLEGGRLTVIFKGGRAPEKIQNYMVTAKSLTDLDAGHYEQIPLDQIDIAATAHANSANGLDFQVPGASHD